MDIFKQQNNVNLLEMQLSRKNIFRVVLIGDPAVGKTSIVNRLHNDDFDLNEQPTIGSTFVNYLCTFEDTSINLQIWDTAGEEQYRSVGPIYYRRAQAAIVVYDVTIESSFNNLQYWINEFKNASNCSNQDIFIVGNKIDLFEKIAVDADSAKKFAISNNFHFFQTSAKTGEGVIDLFQNVAKLCITKNSMENDFTNSLQDNQPQQNDWCC